MSCEPLLPGQHEAERPYTNKIVRQYVLKESGVPAQFGGGPGICHTYNLLFDMFPIQCVTPFCRKLKFSSPQAIMMYSMCSLLVSVPESLSQPRFGVLRGLRQREGPHDR